MKVKEKRLLYRQVVNFQMCVIIQYARAHRALGDSPNGSSRSDAHALVEAASSQPALNALTKRLLQCRHTVWQLAGGW